MVTEAIGDQDMSVIYLLGEKYMNSLETLSHSSIAKTLIFPADIPNAIQGMMGKISELRSRLALTVA